MNDFFFYQHATNQMIKYEHDGAYPETSGLQVEGKDHSNVVYWIKATDWQEGKVPSPVQRHSGWSWSREQSIMAVWTLQKNLQDIGIYLSVYQSYTGQFCREMLGKWSWQESSQVGYTCLELGHQLQFVHCSVLPCGADRWLEFQTFIWILWILFRTTVL